MLDVFAKLGLVPDRCHAVLARPEAETLHVDLQLAGADPDVARLVAANLRRICAVETVLTSEKGMAETG